MDALVITRGQVFRFGHGSSKNGMLSHGQPRMGHGLAGARVPSRSFRATFAQFTYTLLKHGHSKQYFFVLA